MASPPSLNPGSTPSAHDPQVPCSKAEMLQLVTALGTASTRQRQYRTFPQLHKERVLGRGGFAEVLLATAEDGEEVAVKCTWSEPFDCFMEKVEFLASELLVAAAADHPHVLGCYAWDIECQLVDGEAVFRMRMAMPLMVER